jgi:hypothetical protein
MEGSQTTPNLSRRHFAILGLTFAYLIVSSVGAGVSIGKGLPAEWLGLLKSDNEIWVEFMVGGGTALSATVWLLALMAAAATASVRADRLGRVSTLLLSVMSALTVIGALGEPITWRSIAPNTFDPLYLSLSVLLVAVPAALAVVAFSDFRARRAQGSGAGAR